jgi:hypothetical protein
MPCGGERLVDGERHEPEVEPAIRHGGGSGRGRAAGTGAATARTSTSGACGTSTRWSSASASSPACGGSSWNTKHAPRAVEAPCRERVPLGHALREPDARMAARRLAEEVRRRVEPWTSGTPAATSSPATAARAAADVEHAAAAGEALAMSRRARASGRASWRRTRARSPRTIRFE